MPLDYRIAGADQAGLVLSLIQRAFEEYRGRLDPPTGAFDETLDSVGATIAAGGAALAYDGAQPVATALFEPHGNFLYVGRVSVLPTWRGRGIARELMIFLESQARLMGLAATGNARMCPSPPWRLTI